MSLLEDFFKSIHIAVENRPQPYEFFHICFICLSLIIIISICYVTRKNNDFHFRMVLLSVGLILIASEIFKQFYYYYAAGQKGYDWYIFPFQLCSIPMYLSVAVGCMKKNKIRDAICEYLVSIGFLGGIMAYLEPSGILNAHYFTLIHSCIWHALLIFIALYILFTNNACHNLKNYYKVLITICGVIVAATLLNIIFHNKQDFNMCYISPFYNTPLAVFSSFDLIFQDALGLYWGRIISILIYIIAIALGGFIIYGISYQIKKKFLTKV